MKIVFKLIILALLFFLISLFVEEERDPIPLSIEKIEPKKIATVMKKIDEVKVVKKVLKREPLIIDMGKPKDILKENNLTLYFSLNDKKENEHYHYFWYEGEKLLGTEPTLTHAYSLGEHNITLHIIGKNQEGNSSVLVRVWNYKMVNRKELRVRDDEEVNFSFQKTFNYKNQLLKSRYFKDDLLLSMTDYLYDEEGNQIENSYEDMDKPQYSYRYRYVYDEDGNKIEVSYEDKGNPEEYNYRKVYHYEDGTLKSTKKYNGFGELQFDYLEDSREDNSVKYYNKNGKIVKEVKDDIMMSSYHSKSKLLHTLTKSYTKIITTYHYDEEGREIQKEYLHRFDHVFKGVYHYADVKDMNESLFFQDVPLDKVIKKEESDEIDHKKLEHFIIYQRYDSRGNKIFEGSEVIKRSSGCRGGMSYFTPDYNVTYGYDENNNLIEEMQSKNYFNRKVIDSNFTIEYHYSDDVDF